MALVCKLCKRDLTEAAKVFRTVEEVTHTHTIAHLQDLVQDMLRVCTRAATVGWVGREEVALSEDILLRHEIIDGGLF